MLHTHWRDRGEVSDKETIKMKIFFKKKRKWKKMCLKVASNFLIEGDDESGENPSGVDAFAVERVVPPR